MTAIQYARALFEAVSEVRAEDQDKVLDNFVQVLSANGDLSQYDQIEEEYKRLQLEAQGIKQVEVTTARADVDQKALIEELNRIIGQQIQIKHKVDDSIIGGVVVKVDDTLINASLKSNLESLRKDLKNK